MTLTIRELVAFGAGFMASAALGLFSRLRDQRRAMAEKRDRMRARSGLR